MQCEQLTCSSPRPRTLACGTSRRKRKPSQKAADGRRAAHAAVGSLDAANASLAPRSSNAVTAHIAAEVAPSLSLDLSVAELLTQVIGPAAAAYVGRVHVSDMVLAARLEPRAPLANFSVSGQSAIMRAASGLSALVRRQAEELRGACDTLREAGESDAPAWLLGKRAPPHAEAALHALQLHVQALTATLEDALSPSRGYVAVLQRPLSAPERGHIADNTFSLAELHKFLSSAQSLLAQMRCKRGAATIYLQTSAAILDLIALITSVTANNHRERIAEFGQRAAENFVWPTPFFEHAKAVGCPL